MKPADFLKDPRVESVSDERRYDGGIWVYLHYGWRWDDVHSVHEETVGECKREMKRVVVCECDDCVSGLAKRGDER